MLINIQILRFLAALEVLFLHSFADLSDMGFRTPVGDWLSGLGGSGVDIFFVISGFVIQRASDIKPRTFSEFAVDRVKRIAPVYWLATILMTALIYFLTIVGSKENAPAVPIVDFLSSIFFSSQLITGEHPVVRPGWSLEFEMFFYIAFSSTLLLRRNLRFTAILIILLALFAFSGELFVFEFAIGIALSQLTFLGRFRNWNLAFAAIGAIMLSISGLWANVDNLWKWGLPGAMLVAGLAYSQQLRGVIWLRLGRVSYPLYIFHVLVISVIKWPFLRMDVSSGLGWWALCVFVITSIGFAFIVDTCVDAPLQKVMAKALERKRSNRRLHNYRSTDFL